MNSALIRVHKLKIHNISCEHAVQNYELPASVNNNLDRKSEIIKPYHLCNIVMLMLEMEINSSGN